MSTSTRVHVQTPQGWPVTVSVSPNTARFYAGEHRVNLPHHNWIGTLDHGITVASTRVTFGSYTVEGEQYAKVRTAAEELTP